MNKSRLSKWLQYRPGRLGKNTILGSLGLGFRAMIQALYLVLVSRWLGAEGYGWFSGAVALVILGSPLASWGTTYLIPRYIARDRSNSRAMWATALVQTGIIGSLLSVGMLLIALLLPEQPLPWMVFFLLAAAELILLPATHAATSYFYALEHGFYSALSMCLVPLSRVLIILSLIIVGVQGTPENAVIGHFIGSVIGLTVALVLIMQLDGWPDWSERLNFWRATREGTSYALSNAASTSYQEIDKVLMLQILGASAVGTYTVAFRVSSIFALPIAALIGAFLPRMMMMREKKENISQIFRIMIFTALGYGFFAGLLILFFTPIIPILFGTEYSESKQLLILLSPWPFVFALRQTLASWFTANNIQNIRTIIDITGVAVIGILNSLMLSWLGEIGAAVSLITTEIFLITIFIIFMQTKNIKLIQ